MFFQDAGVHLDEEAGAAGALGGIVVDYAFLHPDGSGVDANGGVHDIGDEFRAAENVNDVHFFGNVFQAGVGFLT